MTAIPAIYGDLPDEARAAYGAWMLALAARADHIHGCRSCHGPRGCCPVGIAAIETERAAWRAWDAVRPVEAHDGGH